MKNNLSKQLDLIYALQQKHSDLHVGGSIGLHLHGVKLSRPISNADVDLCKAVDNIRMPECRIEMVGSFENDFDYSFVFNGIKIELKIDKDQKFDLINFGGRSYRVSKIETIMFYKRKYADKGYEKHEKDLVDIEYFMKYRKATA